ncbi:hypothetical protein ACIOD2_04875 [Amycolatopsis sp. NPDC088138]
MLDEAGLTAFDDHAEAALRAEQDPHLVHTSAHLLAIARWPA